jgi:hypothetical protein
VAEGARLLRFAACATLRVGQCAEMGCPPVRWAACRNGVNSYALLHTGIGPDADVSAVAVGRRVHGSGEDPSRAPHLSNLCKAWSGAWCTPVQAWRRRGCRQGEELVLCRRPLSTCCLGAGASGSRTRGRDARARIPERVAGHLCSGKPSTGGRAGYIEGQRLVRWERSVRRQRARGMSPVRGPSRAGG